MKRSELPKRTTWLRSKRPTPRRKQSPYNFGVQPVKSTPKYLGEDAIYHYPDGREICDQKSKLGRDTYHDRKLKMWVRQGKRCALQITDICRERGGRWPQDEIQFDHENGRTSSKHDDRIWIQDLKTGELRRANGSVCPWCNSAKGSRKLPYVC